MFIVYMCACAEWQVRWMKGGNPRVVEKIKINSHSRETKLIRMYLPKNRMDPLTLHNLATVFTRINLVIHFPAFLIEQKYFLFFFLQQKSDHINNSITQNHTFLIRMCLECFV